MGPGLGGAAADVDASPPAVADGGGAEAVAAPAAAAAAAGGRAGEGSGVASSGCLHQASAADLGITGAVALGPGDAARGGRGGLSAGWGDSERLAAGCVSEDATALCTLVTTGAPMACTWLTSWGGILLAGTKMWEGDEERRAGSDG